MLTHVENTFSILIPPGEGFFIRSVRHYANRVQDPEFAKLVQAFIQQEGHHTRAHHEFNRHFKKFGVYRARTRFHRFPKFVDNFDYADLEPLFLSSDKPKPEKVATRAVAQA